MKRDEAKKRLALISDALDRLPDEFSVVSVDLSHHRYRGFPAIHVDRYEYDKRDETALYKYGKDNGLDTKFTENETDNYNGVVVYDPVDVAVFQLVNAKLEEAQDG